jgi:hypothetical protein
MRGRWTATAMVYSGRPDPTWTVDKATADRLLAIWERLPPAPSSPPAPPPLGYRGATLHDADNDRTWLVFQGVVTSAGTNRADPANEFARELLANAPTGVLPPWAQP